MSTAAGKHGLTRLLDPKDPIFARLVVAVLALATLLGLALVVRAFV